MAGQQWIRSISSAALAALAVTACGGTVRDGTGTPSEQLRETAPSRCKAACATVTKCGLDKQSCSCGCTCPVGATNCNCGPCDCGDSTAETPAKCESDCNDSVQRVLQSSSTCVSAMLSLLDCVASASCDEAREQCKAQSKTTQACMDLAHTSAPPVASPGSPSATGVSCMIAGGGGTVPASGSVLMPGTLFCESSWASCSDGRAYDVQCNITSGPELACSCMVNGAPQSSFMTSTCPASTSEANAWCGWQLE